MVTVVFEILIRLVQLYTWVLLLVCIISFLVAFGVMDLRNPTVWRFTDLLNRLTEPLLAPIRRVVPPFANVDFSAMILLLGIQWLVIPLLVHLHNAIISGSLDPLLR